MGLEFSYLLYFKREHLWDALQRVGAFSTPQKPPTLIDFPDHQLSLPLQTWPQTWPWVERRISHDDPEFNFSTSLIFNEDEYILEYVRNLGFEESYRAPPDPDQLNRYLIGYIYLNVYADLPKYDDSFHETDLILMNFQAASTPMSLLFKDSTSIRKKFRSLLASYGGVGGLLDTEYDARLFWWNGRELDLGIHSAYISPTEIVAILNQRETGGFDNTAG